MVAPAQETGRGLPAHRDTIALVQRPAPVDALVNEFCERAYLGLGFTLAVEILCCGQNTGDEQSGIDGRQLAIPRAVAGIHMEKMVEEAAIASRVAFRALFGVGEEVQRVEYTLCGFLAADPAALDANRIGRKPEADCGDAGRDARDRRVRHKAVFRI